MWAVARAALARRDEEISKLRDDAHYATGTAELAMKHRDLVEDALSQYREVARAAQAVLDETDRILAVDPPPIKYRAPYGTLARLRGSLAALALRPQSPAPTEPGVE